MDAGWWSTIVDRGSWELRPLPMGMAANEGLSIQIKSLKGGCLDVAIKYWINLVYYISINL